MDRHPADGGHDGCNQQQAGHELSGARVMVRLRPAARTGFESSSTTLAARWPPRLAPRQTQAGGRGGRCAEEFSPAPESASGGLKSGRLARLPGPHPLQTGDRTMNRTVLAAAVGFTLASTLYVAAQQPVPAPPPGAPAGGRRGGGPPGGGPENGMNTRPPNGEGQKPAFAGQTRIAEQKLNVAFNVQTVTEGLVNPWGLTFLPNGKMLVTERPGRLRVVSADGKQMSEPVAGLPAVDTRGQGGWLDVAIDPAFATNQLIYWSYAEPRDGGMNNTAVARGRFVDGAAPKVENVQVIFHQAPSLNSPLHFGGRLVFARDGMLFITLGDRSIPEGRMQAQRMDGLLGKIVRLNPDGSIPKDNPFVGKEGVRPEIW